MLLVLLKKVAEKEGTGSLMALYRSLVRVFSCSFRPPFSTGPRIADLDLTPPNASGGTSSRQGLWLREELHESFEVPGGGCQVELLGDIPELAQAHPSQSPTQLEF